MLGKLWVGSCSDPHASGCHRKDRPPLLLQQGPTASFINATDAGAMAFKNECASVRSAGASLMRGSAKKGASAARALATGAKVKTAAVKDEEQPQQQQVQQ